MDSVLGWSQYWVFTTRHPSLRLRSWVRILSKPIDWIKTTSGDNSGTVTFGHSGNPLSKEL